MRSPSGGATTDLLFVYGTLRQDLRNGKFHLFAQHARYIGYADLQGMLFDLGEYPGVVLAPLRNVRVRGEVYAIADPRTTFAVLDDYEGCGRSSRKPYEFERVEAPVTLESGPSETAWVYIYAGSTAGKRRVVSGDYLPEVG